MGFVGQGRHRESLEPPEGFGRGRLRPNLLIYLFPWIKKPCGGNTHYVKFIPVTSIKGTILWPLAYTPDVVRPPLSSFRTSFPQRKPHTRWQSLPVAPSTSA